MFRLVVTATAIMTIAVSTSFADFSYQEKTTITGGSVAAMLKVAGVFSKQAREPIQSTVAVKGNKLVHHTAQRDSIIDLDSQTITDVDLQKKTYSVLTFEQMKQMMEEAAQKMHQQDPNQQMKFKVSANKTSNTKQIGGMDTKEMILRMEMESTDQKSGQTGSMVITTDMWIATAPSGYAEVRAFYKRMAEKINWAPGGNMFMGQPGVAQGMAEVYKEIGKLDGVPVYQVITMGAAGQPGAAGGEGAPPQPAAQPQPAEDKPKPSVGGALGGALGGRFGLGRKKTQQQDTSSSQSASSSQSGASGAPAGTMIEMTVESSGFSSTADASMFSVPAGFKQVETRKR